jgi:hypothetical protein
VAEILRSFYKRGGLRVAINTLPNLFNEVSFMVGCPLGLEFCDQEPVLSGTKCYAIICDNYFYCRSWTLSWNLPLHRITAENSLKFDCVGQDYYLVEFVTSYGYPRPGMQERDWAAYFAEYGYAEAVPIPKHNSHLRKVTSLSTSENRIIPVLLANGMRMMIKGVGAVKALLSSS